MARRFASLAEKYRHHRKCFELALELGCTPREAEVEMARMEARERARALDDRFKRRSVCSADVALPMTEADFREWDAGWMMRD